MSTRDDLDALESAADAARYEILALIARLREAEDAMNVCARCGEAIDAEVQAEEARSSASSIQHSPDPYAEAQRLRQEPVVDLMAALEASLTAAKAARQKQAEEADAATPTPSNQTPE